MKAQCAVCVKCRYRVLLKHYTLCGSDVTMLGAGTLTLSYIRADCHLYGSWHCEQTATLLVVVEETLWSVYRVGKWKAVSTVNLCFMCVLTAGRQCLFGRPVTKGKGKVNPVQALSLCTGRTPYRGSRGIALLFLDHGTIRGWGVSVTPRPLFTPGKDPVLIVQKAGWASGPVLTGAENLAPPPTGIRCPDRPARSQSLYRLIYLPPTPSLRNKNGALKVMFSSRRLWQRWNFWDKRSNLESVGFWNFGQWHLVKRNSNRGKFIAKRHVTVRALHR